mmetsp:Transcript_20688/g.58926  ORF Transcript_20688/g.58926 Transcript_20688/m.58926 type:complete len:1674 (-) Transcript_20688:99-5120(-)|eukprot:CAMPEP_0119571912 /NCGR_PEP_ID=MMETSP1352-20130426/44352_1 /TAXON_ID=265584 /ORGANISM="Stauroneis constricta, Strain CCMP1120" /LENGTH=1673 /DNA_ID=CAMNT_0007621595 /DNA_START=4808 /DNA_END=9829 /DNA_ORIENTATION=+
MEGINEQLQQQQQERMEEHYRHRNEHGHMFDRTPNRRVSLDSMNNSMHSNIISMHQHRSIAEAGGVSTNTKSGMEQKQPWRQPPPESAPSPIGHANSSYDSHNHSKASGGMSVSKSTSTNIRSVETGGGNTSNSMISLSQHDDGDTDDDVDDYYNHEYDPQQTTFEPSAQQATPSSPPPPAATTPMSSSSIDSDEGRGAQIQKRSSSQKELTVTKTSTSSTIAHEVPTNAPSHLESKAHNNAYYCVGRDFYDDQYHEQDDIVSVEDTIDFTKLAFYGRKAELNVLQGIYLDAMEHYKHQQHRDQQSFQHHRNSDSHNSRDDNNRKSKRHRARQTNQASASASATSRSRPTNSEPASPKPRQSSSQSRPPPNACLIRGVSGCGKSSLVDQLQKRLNQLSKPPPTTTTTATTTIAAADKGAPPQPYFLKGKFDELAGSDPLSAFSQAFSCLLSYFDQSTRSTHDELARIRSSFYNQISGIEQNGFDGGIVATPPAHDQNVAATSANDHRMIQQYLCMLNPSLEVLFGQKEGAPAGEAAKRESQSTNNSATNIAAAAAATANNKKKRRSIMIGRRSSTFLQPSTAVASAAASAAKMVSANTTATTEVTSKAFQWKQLKYLVQTFCGAIASPERPLILYFDDLQWADKDSLDLLSSLLTTDRCKHFLFIGSFRSDEMEYPAQFKEQSYPVIDLKNLTFREMTDFLSVALKLNDAYDDGFDDEESMELNDVAGQSNSMSQEQQQRAGDAGAAVESSSIQQRPHRYSASTTKSSTSYDANLSELATAIYSKTRGNIFFTVQVLEELVRKNILYFSRMTFSWEWNLENVDLDEVLSDNIIEAIVSKIQTTTKTLQSVLKVAAYSNRLSVHVDILHSLLGMDGVILNSDELDEVLEQAVEQGLFCRVGPTAAATTSSCKEYRFVHDRIQQASISLVPEGRDRDMFRYHMGHRLLKLARAKSARIATPEERSWMWYAAVDHFNATQYTMNHDPIFVTRLNLQVGEKAVHMAAFDTASDYLQNSLSTLLKLIDPWRNHYDLTLRLYRTIAEVEFCQGHFELGYGIAERVFSNTRNLEDKLPTYLSLAIALGREEEHEDALILNRDVLFLLNAYPQRLLALHAFRDHLFIKQYLARNSDESILDLPQNMQKDHERKMSLLNELSTQALYCDSTRDFQVSALQMVRLTLQCGHSSYSAIAFVKYGLMLSKLNHRKGASRAADLARAILHHLPSRQSACMSEFIMTHWIDAWSSSHDATLNAYKQGQKIGMHSGDFHNAFLNAFGALQHAHGCGYPLLPLEMAAVNMLEQMKLDGARSTASMVEQVQLGIQTFSSASEEPVDYDQLALFKPRHDGHSESFRLLYGYMARCEIGIFFGNFEFAHVMALRMWEYIPGNTAYMVCNLRMFYAGLAALGMARITRKHKYVKKGRKWYRKLTAINRRQGNRDHHREFLLAAVLKSTQRANEKVVKAHYYKAIDAALGEGQIHNAALANEFLGEYFIDLSKRRQARRNQGEQRQSRDVSFVEAKHYITEARDLYLQWGAKAKVAHLQQTRPEYMGSSGVEWRSITGETSTHRSYHHNASNGDALSASGRNSVDLEEVFLDVTSSSHHHRTAGGGKAGSTKQPPRQQSGASTHSASNNGNQPHSTRSLARLALSVSNEGGSNHGGKIIHDDGSINSTSRRSKK